MGSVERESHRGQAAHQTTQGVSVSGFQYESQHLGINAWPVLGKSLSNGSTANTPLATPLWIPQLLWLSGYAWFAITTSVLGLRVLVAACLRDTTTLETLAGPDHGESEGALAQAASTTKETR